VSITIMEMVDDAIMLLILGAMQAGLSTAAAAFPVSRWMIARGRGHAVVHGHHGHR
jgi:hypothetical protein